MIDYDKQENYENDPFDPLAELHNGQNEEQANQVDLNERKSIWMMQQKMIEEDKLLE